MLAGKEQRCDVGIRPALRELSGSRDSEAARGPLWFRRELHIYGCNPEVSAALCWFRGRKGNKLASFPEPLCACVLIVKKATAPGVEEDLCVPSL